MGALLATQLIGAGEHVVDVAPKLSARVRLMDNGRIDKTDPNDARSAALVALRNPTLNTVTGECGNRVILRLLADRYHQLTAQCTGAVCGAVPARRGRHRPASERRAGHGSVVPYGDPGLDHL